MMVVSDGHSIHYSEDDISTYADFGGFWGFLIKLCELARDLLVVYQGWIGYKATKEDSLDSSKGLIKKTIWIVGYHLGLIVISMVFGAIAIGEDDELYDPDVDMGIEGIDDMYEVAFAIIFATFFFACCCTICCCGSILGLYHMYKQSNETYVNLRSYNLSQRPHTHAPV
mmetsp:Transcript_22319/g.24825  ORF Transcript_22319/g.24825 Transcript_22319/m.24825 type:complete len:170 (+) Transcript_22319:356-865(+)